MLRVRVHTWDAQLCMDVKLKRRNRLGKPPDYVNVKWIVQKFVLMLK